MFASSGCRAHALIDLVIESRHQGGTPATGEFGWKPETFWNPKKFIDAADARNYKVVLDVVIEDK